MMRARLDTATALQRALCAGVTFALVSAGLCGAAEPWQTVAELTHPVGNLEFRAPWQVERGLQLRVDRADAAARIALHQRECTVATDPADAAGPHLQGGARFHKDRLPGRDTESVLVLLKFRPEGWWLYVDDRLVAELPPALTDPTTVLLLAETVQDDSVPPPRFQRTTGFAFRDNFMVPEEQEDLLAEWEIESGEWLMHTAADNVSEQLRVSSRGVRLPEPDRSPNFHSLLGKGSNALITAGYDFYDAYTLEAALRTGGGEAGLVFYLRNAASYHAFTIEADEDDASAVLRLWRTDPGTEGGRHVLQAVRVPITSGQWVKPQVRVSADHVSCYLDNAPVMETRTTLPPGGAFGLYAGSVDGVRFDDVSAETDTDLALSAGRDFMRYAVHEHGDFFSQSPRSGLAPAVSSDHQWLALGSTRQGGHVCAAAFTPVGSRWSVGLLAGYQSPDEPHYRFSYRRGEGHVLLLERVQGTQGEVVERVALPGGGDAQRLRLMIDETEPDTLRCYLNGLMALVHHPEQPVAGASGLYVGPRTETRIALMERHARRHDLYRNQFEKNRYFIDDPFMRHWSSPEGEWIPDQSGLTWHKGDFFGRFLVRMPFIPDSEVHVGVEEGQTNGAVVLKAVATGVALLYGDGAEDSAEPGPIAEAPLDAWITTDEDTVRNTFTLNYEGLWVWVTSGGRFLFKHRLPSPLKGTRMRIAGFETEILRSSYVERYNVKDYLFTRSLHDWVINGGQWQIVNRFNCQPRWSHMDGESADGLAALWTKYEYEGDFCAEVYAGIRHGWYAQRGGLNMTVLNSRTSPSEGYTVTASGWDPDFSQLLTRLYRNGEAVAETDKYLVPRIREGSARLGFNPLLPEGNKRSMHGAWYYMKLRRIGSRLEYYFDNELVFAYDDPDPIDVGSMGIWTYMNSMVVARVKIAAERIRPQSLVVEPATLPARRSEPATEPSSAAVLNHGRPLDLCSPSHWTVNDQVGRSRLTWHEDETVGRFFRVENLLGSGEMFAACNMPPASGSTLAGWRFLVRLTSGARMNVHYSVGQEGANGEYTPTERYYHRITGTDIAEGPIAMAGASDLDGGPEQWRPVTVWINRQESPLLPLDAARTQVRLEGFGNLQPSYTVQGLNGNAPGERYEIAELVEIHYRVPRLSIRRGARTPEACSIADGAGRTGRLAGIDELQAALEAADTPGLVERRLELATGGRTTSVPLAWVTYPDAPRVTCAWSKTLCDTLLLHCAEAYPDRRFTDARVLVAGHPVPTEHGGPGLRLAAIPCEPEFAGLNLEELEVVLVAGARRWTFPLAPGARPLPRPPALVSLEGIAPFYRNMETPDPREAAKSGMPAYVQRELEARRKRAAQEQALRNKPDRKTQAWLPTRGLAETSRAFDPQQGYCLNVANNGAAARLRTSFYVDLPAARYPIFQFRYKAGNMVNVSLAVNSHSLVSLNEDEKRARTVRPDVPFLTDGQWHTWQGVIAEATAIQTDINEMLKVRQLSLGSAASVDQTGLYSEWRIDDLVLGPAASTPEQLAFTPRYFDLRGVQAVSMALRAGGESYCELSEDQAAALAWTDIANGEETVPDIGGLPDGYAHLFIKAVNIEGRESQISDIPFLLDRVPMSVTCRMAKTDHTDFNGSALSVMLDPLAGSPPDLSGATARLAGQAAPDGLLGSAEVGEDAALTLTLNWPLMFREQLQSMRDGDRADVVLSDIRDGSGNASPDVHVPIAVNYAEDDRPPTIHAVEHPSNVLFLADDSHDARARELERKNPAAAAQWARRRGKTNGRGYTRLMTETWRIADHPYVAFRVRAGQRRGRATGWPGINMVVGFMYRQPLVISLDVPGKVFQDEREAALATGGKNGVPWPEKEWRTFNMDLRRVLAGHLKPRDLKSECIRYVMIPGRAALRQMVVDVADMCVFSEWDADATVRVDAFDISGVAELLYGRDGRTDTMEIRPASIHAADWEDGWLSLRVRDRAGNISKPMRIPSHASLLKDTGPR